MRLPRQLNGAANWGGLGRLEIFFTGDREIGRARQRGEFWGVRPLAVAVSGTVVGRRFAVRPPGAKRYLAAVVPLWERLRWPRRSVDFCFSARVACLGYAFRLQQPQPLQRQGLAQLHAGAQAQPAWFCV